MAASVELRAVRDGDVPIFFEQQLDPEATRMAAFPARSPEAHFAHWAKVRADPAVVVRTILSGGQVAGHIGSFDQGGERQVGYWVGRAFWGRGVATQALRAFLHLDPTRPLLAHVAVHNTASRRVVEKCGFLRLREEKGVSLNGGEPVDEVVYALDA